MRFLTLTTSVDFELPDHYVPQTLVLEIGKMIGINLRDQRCVCLHKWRGAKTKRNKKWLEIQFQ